LREAEELATAAVDKLKSFVGDEHPKTLIGKAVLALIYQDQGKLKEAEELHETVLRDRMQLLGRKHYDTIKSVAFLAALYRKQGRDGEAKKLEKEHEELGTEEID